MLRKSQDAFDWKSLESSLWVTEQPVKLWGANGLTDKDPVGAGTQFDHRLGAAGL